MPFLALAWKAIGIKGAIAIAFAVACGFLYLSLKVQNARLEAAQEEVSAHKAAIASLNDRIRLQNASIEAAKAAATAAARAAAAERKKAAADAARLRADVAALAARIDSAEAATKNAQNAADEIRALLLKDRGVAQPVEHLTHNQEVGGSTPSPATSHLGDGP